MKTKSETIIKPGESAPPVVALRYPSDAPRTIVGAYVRGAIDYATGLGLDRLAKDLETERRKTESDHDLSQRLVKLLSAHPINRPFVR